MLNVKYFYKIKKEIYTDTKGLNVWIAGNNRYELKIRFKWAVTVIYTIKMIDLGGTIPFIIQMDGVQL